MHYFLFVRTVGLCARIALNSTEFGEDHPCIVHSEGKVWDTNQAATLNHISIGIPLKEAKMILQDRAVYVEYKPEKFEKVRDMVLEPCLKYSDHIQAELAGEGLIDLSSHPQPLEIAGLLLGDLHKSLGLPLFAGIAPSAWLARASAQMCHTAMLNLKLLPIEAVTDPEKWLEKKPVSKLTPLSKEDRAKLFQLGLDQVSQIQKAPLARLEEQFPKRGLFIQQAALGKLSDQIIPNYPSKLIAEEIHLGGTENLLDIDDALGELSRTLSSYLCRTDQQAGSLRLTVVFNDETRLSNERKFNRPVIAASQLFISLKQSLVAFDLNKPVDLLRVQIVDLSPSVRKQSEFNLTTEVSRSDALLNNTLKRLESSFGTGIVKAASQITLPYNSQVLGEWKRATGWK